MYLHYIYTYVFVCQGRTVLQPFHPYHLLQYTSAPGYRPHKQDLIPIIMTTGLPGNQSKPSERHSVSGLVSQPAACCGMPIFNLSAAMHIHPIFSQCRLQLHV